MAYNINPSEYEEMEECPYNKSHQILKFRMQTHLVKCKKNYPDCRKLICHFNATHHINEPEFEYHLKNCPDRASFERYKNPICTQEINFESKPKLEMNSSPFSDSDANWDNINIESYDPKKYVQNAAVLRHANGLTPSERKAFRAAEILRLGALNK